MIGVDDDPVNDQSITVPPAKVGEPFSFDAPADVAANGGPR